MQFLIDFSDAATEQQISEYLLQNSCTSIKTFSSILNVYLVECNSIPPITDLVTSVVNDSENPIQLLNVEELHLPQTSLSTTISTSDQNDWWKTLSVVDIDYGVTTANIPIFGTDTNVYLVDSGIDITHPEFTGKNVELVHSFTNDFTDTNGHGTALASVIVGNTCSITNTNLKVVKIFDSSKPTLQSDLLAAFDAIILHAGATSNFSIINISWSIPKNVYIESKIKYLIDAGFAIVVSAGNSGIPIDNVTPASMTEVQTIGAYNVDFEPCSFSNYTSPDLSVTQGDTNFGELDSWAPGENIRVALPGGLYSSTAGTSVAAAIYSACLAYNSSQYLDSDKSLIKYFRSQPGNNSCGALNFKERTGLLKLTGQYSNSANRICTYLQHPLPSARYENARNEKFVIFPGNITKLFYPTQVKQYELLTALPQHISIKNGFIEIDSSYAFSNPIGVDVLILDFAITSINGNAFNDSLTLVIKSRTFDASLLPPNDPLIEITLTSDCVVQPGSCADGCLLVGCCDYTPDFKSCYCIC